MSDASAAPRERDDILLERSSSFAAELHSVLLGVLPAAPGAPRVRWAPEPHLHTLVQQLEEGGIPLTADGVVVLRLRFQHHCGWDRSGRFLAVRRSSIAVTTQGTDEPLFRYDYDATSDEKVPAAHLNVHSHRDELVFAMMAAGHRLRGRARTSAVRRGKVPRVSTLHFPLGGHRFRPSLEDVLEMLVREFGLDVRDGWQEALRDGRDRWRAVQLRAAVCDDPAVAAGALADLGYDVRRQRAVPAG